MIKWTPADQLDLANRHVLQGEARCARQATLIEYLKVTDQDITEAAPLLLLLEQTLELMRQHQQRLLYEKTETRHDHPIDLATVANRAAGLA
jgi:hypothetical protein